MKIKINDKKNKENLKGGDGYSINVNQAIGGLPAFSRYSNNYRPVFEGELLQNGGGCGCKKKKTSSIYDLIKMQGGNKNKNKKSQFDAIREVTYSLTPLKTNSLKKIITKLFLYDLMNKNKRLNTNKTNKREQQ
jgi:hypothetical protein